MLSVETEHQHVEHGPASLVKLCLQVALATDFWRVQRRHLACLPEEAANALLADLLSQDRLDPPHLELFRWCVTSVRLSGAAVDGEWTSYLLGFRALLELRLARCCRLRDVHLSGLGQLAPTLRVLSLEGCQALTPRTAEVVTQLSGLLDLGLDDTHLGHVAGRLGHITGLTRLRLGGLPTRDADCEALAQLTGLRELVLWGSEVGDAGVAALSTLTGLTCLDLSLTAAHAPPPLPCLRHLAMIHCELDLAHEGQRQLWLGGGPPVLPAIENLQLHKAAVQLPWGQALLAALVSGAAPALRTLNLSGCNVEDLSLLAAATALRELDLAEARVGPGLLGDEALGALALLPLTALNLDRTAASDAGVGQLLAMTGLRQLSLACVGVGDGCWAVLAQLPALEALDLSNSRFSAGLGILPQGAGHAAARAGRGAGRHAPAAGPAAAAVAAAAAGLAPPHPAAAVTRRRSGSYDPPRLGSLTSLRLLNTKVDDLGCRRLAPLLPVLRSLALSSGGVSDAGFRTLCEGLRGLRSLEASGLMLTDQGLHAAGQLSALTRLVVSDCWLVSDKEAAAVAARGHVLREVRLNGRPVSPALTPSTSLGRNATLSPRSRTLSDEAKAFDERLRYGTDELLAMREAPLAPPMLAEVRARVPRDLRADLWKELM